MEYSDPITLNKLTTMELKPIPRFNDHGAGCKGHANWMLDCTFEKQEERDVMIQTLDHYISRFDKEIADEANLTESQ